MPEFGEPAHPILVPSDEQVALPSEPCCGVQRLKDPARVQALGELCDRIERCQIAPDEAQAKLDDGTKFEADLVFICVRRRLANTCDIPRDERYLCTPSTKPAPLRNVIRSRRRM